MFTIILTVILIMPGDGKDIVQSRDMPSLLKCFDAAMAWTSQDVRLSGGVGFAAGCSIADTPEKNRS